jgi:OOP family OmpA-OmpF porin
MDVQPQAVSARSVPAGTVQDLTSGLVRLINAFARGAREKNPKLTARAQAMFDCWIEEQEENIQPEDIASCRSAFEQAMEFVGASLTVAAPAPAPAPAPAAPTPLPALTGPYIVYFDFDSAEVKGIELGMVKRAALDAKEVGAISIVLSGHADRAGNSEYNMALSRAHHRRRQCHHGGRYFA